MNIPRYCHLLGFWSFVGVKDLHPGKEIGGQDPGLTRDVSTRTIGGLAKECPNFIFRPARQQCMKGCDWLENRGENLDEARLWVFESLSTL